MLEGEQTFQSEFSKHFSMVWVLDLGYTKLKSASKMYSEMFPKSSFGRGKVITKYSRIQENQHITWATLSSFGCNLAHFRNVWRTFVRLGLLNGLRLMFVHARPATCRCVSNYSQDDDSMLACHSSEQKIAQFRTHDLRKIGVYVSTNFRVILKIQFKSFFWKHMTWKMI